MRLFYFIFFMLQVSLLPVSAADGVVHKKLPLSQSLPFLKSIQDDAIRMGDGPVKVHVFVDPLCPHSRNFVEMIVESEKMRHKYSYYFYLYTLKRMHSEAMVFAIYHSKDPLASMKAMMVDHEENTPFKSKDENASTIISRIEKVAEKLDVYKRPYMVMVKKPKKKRGTH